MIILGAHMSIAGGFAQAAQKTGEQYGCNAMQIFTKSPRSRQVKPIDPADAQTFRELCAQHKIQHIVAHSSYLLNFGKPISEIEWALRDITTDFERVATLGGHGVVVHIGKSLDGDRNKAIQNVIENAKIVIDQTEKLVKAAQQNSATPTTLDYILENTAGQGTEIGFQLEELAQIWKGLHKFSPRLKSCLDTAHIWAAGYDISTASSAQKTLQDYDQLIGLKTLSCFHFNDSKKELGSKVDRHENIGHGLIKPQNDAKAKPEGLATIAQFAAAHSIPLILETPEANGQTHQGDIEQVKKMVA